MEARRRALTGVEQPVYYKGEAVGRIAKYSDTLLIFLLKAHWPKKSRDNVSAEHSGKDNGPIQEENVNGGCHVTGEVEVGWGWREKVGRRPAEYYNRREPQKSAAPPGNVIPINVTRHSEPWGHHASMVSRLPYSANLGYYKNRRRLRVAERADRLLTYLVEEAYELGHVIAFTDLPADVAEFLSGGDGTLKHTMSHDVNLRAYAWTESNDWDAVGALLDFLEQHLMIARTESIHRQQGWHIYTVTVNGYARVEEIQSIVASRQAFVAMWFDSNMDEVYENGIQPAIEATGFSAKVINRDPTVEKIDDAIIAEIRRSKFIVADFTHGDDGARGGVYFEAGFAMGLGIPVICTCRGDMITKVHFDTRQYNHIVWNDLDELRRRLEERIRARIT